MTQLEQLRAMLDNASTAYAEKFYTSTLTYDIVLLINGIIVGFHFNNNQRLDGFNVMRDPNAQETAHRTPAKLGPLHGIHAPALEAEYEKRFKEWQR
jgi:hypothetical protein